MSTGSYAMHVGKEIGISAISTHEPPWELSNQWFEGTIPSKFVKHTGIEARRVSTEDEVSMAVQAVRNLQHQVGCDLRNCRALILAAPSFVPIVAARKHLDDQSVRHESTQRAARRLALRLGIPSRHATGINWFCVGYAKALSILMKRLRVAPPLRKDEFALVVTVSRISRITDFACKQSGALFGDMATATLLTTTDSQRHPVHFKLLHAEVETQAAEGVFFDFHLRDNVLSPMPDGGKYLAPQRLVFSLNGLGIADAAPRAMADSLSKSLDAQQIPADQVNYVVPHQAGTGIVRLTAMKLEQAGICCPVVNGLTTRVGNVSSCSIPFALHEHWQQLHGTVACPTAAVGNPGEAKISAGCILLQATQLHGKLAGAA